MAFKLYQRQGGNVWWVSFTTHGKRIRQSTRTTVKSQANEVAAKLEWEAIQERIHGPESVLTFGEAVTIYLLSDKPDRFIDTLYKQWEHKRVKDIQPGHIQDLARKLFPNAKPATRNRQVIAPIQAILNHCAERGLCQPIKVRKFAVEKHIPKVADPKWLDAFIVEASPHLGALAMFMAYTAARISEAVRLEWQHVDLKQGTALLTKTKTDPRVCTLPPALVLAMGKIKGRKGPVFKYKSRMSVYSPWNAAIKRAGIEKISPHDAGRRMFATEMNKAGVDPVTGAKAGGWKTVSMYLNTYAQPGDVQDAVNQVFGTKLAHLPEKNRKNKGNSKA